MKKTLLILPALFIFLFSHANHITGGEMFYTLTGQAGNNYTYHITLKLYRDCNAPAGSAELEPFAGIGIFNNTNNGLVWNNSVPKSFQDTLSIGSPNPCIVNPPVVCYQVAYYEFDVTLPGNITGYTVAFQRCCRISGINNLQVPSSSAGATYTAQIPGTTALAGAPANNSARFMGADTVIVCAGEAFTYDFGAVDPDQGDSLAYFFCQAITSIQNPPNPNPPLNPGTFTSVNYNTPTYDASFPLGSTVGLNTFTGLVSGIAPSPGIYVITVCVNEYRDGILIATQRKDLQIKVGDCNQVQATLPTSAPLCDDFSRFFANQAPPSSLINSWEWTFGDGDTSFASTPTHTYADTGTYSVKLVVNRGDLCADSATMVLSVYPGFFPGFEIAGVCATKPTQFFDTTRTVYGFVNSWRWDFGDLSTNADTSRLQDPSWAYPTTGTRNVRFIVTSNKGCIDTLFKDITILDKPPLSAIPKDTLICNGDNLQLQAFGIGNFSWTGPNITNGNTATPTVSPTSTSDYIVQLTDNGCINRDTVRVRVIDFVTLNAMPDTVICATDSVRLRAVTDGLQFVWTPATTLDDPTLLSPSALPLATTTYQISSTVGGCTTTDNVTVTLVPYPQSDAGPDATICFDGTTQLAANIVGNAFTWSPSASLSNANVLNPFASPLSTTNYILTVTDIQGCPKPRRDTVVVTVLPKVNAFAGRDTLVVVGQPLQFNASGGVNYAWSPSTNLSAVNINNPVATYDGSFDSIRYKVVISNELGCVDSAYITVKIFNTDPQIFVPTAFTPNGDGRNDVFRPVAVGISKFDYFRVYNRWGQMVYSSTNTETGWDGRINGKMQGSNTYVWIVRGTDFTGKVRFAKGTVVLIR